MVKNLLANTGDPGSIPGLGKIPWRRARQPTPGILAWENPTDRGGWRATARGFAKSWPD